MEGRYGPLAKDLVQTPQTSYFKIDWRAFGQFWTYAHQPACKKAEKSKRDSWESLMDEFSWWSKQIAKNDHHQHFCPIARRRFHFGGISKIDLFVAIICHHQHNLPPSVVLNMLSSSPSFISPVLPWPVPTLLQCSIFVLFSPISCCWKSWHHKRGNLCRPRSSSITWAIADQINIIQRYSTICPTPSQWQIFQGKIVIIANCCTFFYPSAPFWEIRTKLSRHQPIYHRSRPKLLILWRTVIFVVDFK